MKRSFFGLLAVPLLGVLVSSASAETIIKIGLGSAGFDGNDVDLTGNVFSTMDDGDSATLGDQNTNVNFVGFLSGRADIPADVASFTIADVAISGTATILGNVLVQPTNGGSISLWDASNTLLLSASVGGGAIVGSLGSAATGSFANLTVGNFTGGTLAPLLTPNSFSISLAMTDVNGGAGLGQSGGDLLDFTAGATANISALQVPEPTSMVLCGLSALGLIGAARSRRS